MDAQKVSEAILSFARTHEVSLKHIGNRQTQLLELGAVVGVVHHYRVNGFSTVVQNPPDREEFRVKLSTQGHPADYSRVVCTRNGEVCEIHSNLSVRGAHDDGIYCVDVAVVEPNVVPTEKGGEKWGAAPNGSLISFAEAKKLNVYPMLLAHFVGIAHEILPHFLDRTGRPRPEAVHLRPTLITLGRLSGNSSVIIDGFASRNFDLLIADSFDFRLGGTRRNPKRSPFLPKDQLFAKPDDDPVEGYLIENGDVPEQTEISGEHEQPSVSADELDVLLGD